MTLLVSHTDTKTSSAGVSTPTPSRAKYAFALTGYIRMISQSSVLQESTIASSLNNFRVIKIYGPALLCCALAVDLLTKLDLALPVQHSYGRILHLVARATVMGLNCLNVTPLP